MRIIIKQRSYFFKILFLLLIMFSFSTDSSVFATIPDGLVIEKQFKPGYGVSVGRIQFIIGRVVITHQGIPSGFIAQKNHPLFKGDTIHTDKNARARFKLNDGSIMTLSSSTKLTINQSIYSPKKKQQSSFLDLSIGKARFWVVKLLKYKNSNFKVKTSTFVAGVRGSDFIIIATPEHAELTALADTKVDVAPLADPEAPPVLVTAFQRTSVKRGGFPRTPVKVPMKKIDALMKEFIIQGEEKGTGKGKHTGKADKNEKNKGKQKPEDLQIPPGALGKLEDFKDPKLMLPKKNVIPRYMNKPDLNRPPIVNKIIRDAELNLPPLPEMPEMPVE